jgi:hypothetical protein
MQNFEQEHMASIGPNLSTPLTADELSFAIDFAAAQIVFSEQVKHPQSEKFAHDWQVILLALTTDRGASIPTSNIKWWGWHQVRSLFTTVQAERYKKG